MQPSRDFTFGRCNRFTAAETTDVGRADVGDHRKIRLGAAGETLDLPRPPHAHLNHQGRISCAGAQNGEGNADIVVVVAFAGLNRSQRSQCRSNQLPGCGFAG